MHHHFHIIERFTRAACTAALVWVAAATCASAQLGQVVGQVTDPDGMPLAAVAVEGGSAAALTDAGGIYRLNDVDQQSRVVIQFSKAGFATTYGIVDLEVPDTGGDDADGDGIPDDEDDCPLSDLSPTVVVGDCDSGVENILQEDGCTISDLLAECAEGARNHGQFVRCARGLTKDLVADGLLSKREAIRIFRCAAQSNQDDDSSSDDSSSSEESNSSDESSSSDDSSIAPPAPPIIVNGVAPGTPTFATLSKVMVPCGEPQVVSAENGGTVEQDGFKVTFLPGTIDASGDVEVVVCPIDVSSAELGGFPGDYMATDINGNPVQLETFSLMDVTLSQGGLPVNLAPGQQAVLEFLLPVDTPLLPGDMIALWFFDATSGLWVEEGDGLVGVSSMDPARLSVIGMVSHFSWWNCDRPISTFSCVEGVVTDANGNPVAGAQVIASGVDYNGSSFSSTDDNGAYCANVRIDSTVNVVASAFNGVVQSAGQVVDTGAANVTCDSGGCVVVNLSLPDLSCIEGVVLDAGGAAVPGVQVVSSAGTVATSAADGTFCLTAPADSQVSLFAGGFPAETVLTAGATDCTAGGCTPVVLQEPPVGGGTACISGEFFLDDFNPAGELVVAVDVATGLPVGTVGVTDVNAAYCIEGVPLGINVFVEGQGPTCNNAESEVFNTGSTEGDCQDSPADCVVAPILNCFGGPGEFAF